jgi:glycosyltransferase involved in cell wall biosynthesis
MNLPSNPSVLDSKVEGLHSMGSLAVLIPVFNEAPTIREIIGRVLAKSFVSEVVVVDDGSTDGVYDLLTTQGTRNERVKIIKHIGNRGKGAAIRTALSHSDSALVLIQDADLEYDPVDYKKLVECMQHSTTAIVYGSRFMRESHVTASSSWQNSGNRLLTRFGNWVTGQTLTDEATCYKLFRREILEQMNLQEDGFGFCPEVTAKAGRLGIRILEVPISYRPRNRREGKKIRIWHGFEALWCLLKYTWFDRSLVAETPHRVNAVRRRYCELPRPMYPGPSEANTRLRSAGEGDSK